MPRPLKHARSLARMARSSTPVLIVVVAVAALGLGSVSYAAGLVTGRDVKDRSSPAARPEQVVDPQGHQDGHAHGSVGQGRLADRA